MTLPPLPEPAFTVIWDGARGGYYVNKPNIGTTAIYTAEQMRERDRAIVELCAQTVEGMCGGEFRAIGWSIAETIRSLLTKEKP